MSSARRTFPPPTRPSNQSNTTLLKDIIIENILRGGFRILVWRGWMERNIWKCEDVTKRCCHHAGTNYTVQMGPNESYIAHNDKECINWKIIFIFRKRKNNRLISQRRLLILNFKIFFIWLVFFSFLWLLNLNRHQFCLQNVTCVHCGLTQKATFFFTEEKFKLRKLFWYSYCKDTW